MIDDLASRDAAQALHADVCIIGAGAAGLALAAEFFGTRWRVLVLESGDAAPTAAAAAALNETVSVGVPHAGGIAGRVRALGGTTTAWGGQLLPLRASETDVRPWVPHSGWPLAATDLPPYYRRAERLLGVDEPPYDERSWERCGPPAPALDSRQFLYRVSQWAPLTRRNLALLLRGPLKSATNVEVLLGATVVDISSDAEHNRVAHVEIKTRDGRAFRVNATLYVVCSGGIETPRLLLAARGGAGIANSSGLVGCFFQDHISYVAGEIPPPARAVIRRHFEPRYRAGSMYTCKIEPSDETLARHELLNVMAHVKFEIPDALGLLEAKRMLQELQLGKLPIPSLRAALALAGGAAELARLLFARTVLSRRAAPSRGKLLLLIDVEQAPNPVSRIRLAQDTDRYGVPKALVDWRLTGQEVQTIEKFTALLTPEWARAGLGKLTHSGGEVTFGSAEAPGTARDIYHHMGGTRMSDSPHEGVVDRHLKCHDTDNLYIAGSAVFPAGGIANPTFTILALTIRLADRLKERLAAH